MRVVRKNTLIWGFEYGAILKGSQTFAQVIAQ